MFDLEVYLESARVRLKSKVVIDDNGCWLYRGADNGVYGVFSMKPLGMVSVYAHRASWMLFRGEIPSGICVCHHCDVPVCINPDHLFLGTYKENIQDMMVKGRENNLIGLDVANKKRRGRTKCKQGHEYTEENTHWYRDMRVCKICRRASGKKYDERTQRKKVNRNG